MASRYNEFVSQIQLARVWLQSAGIENHRGFHPPEGAGNLVVEHSASWSQWDKGFDALSKYRFRLTEGERLIGEIEAVFGLRYVSPVRMTKALFELFSSQNLMLNSWPYAREFLASATSRFGWLPVTLPVFRPGLGISTPTFDADSEFPTEPHVGAGGTPAARKAPSRRRKTDATDE